MESNPGCGEKTLNNFPLNRLLVLAEKIEVVGNAMLVGVIVMCAYNYIGRHIGSYYRRFRQLKQDIAEFTRDYREVTNQDVYQEVDIENPIDSIIEPSTAEFEESSDEAIAQEDHSADDWDFGSSDDTDAYETDVEDDPRQEIPELSGGFVNALVHVAGSFAPIERLREEVRITNTIEFDEYLLSKGLIENSEFGKSLMVEI